MLGIGRADGDSPGIAPHRRKPDRVQMAFPPGNKGRCHQSSQHGKEHPQRQGHPQVPAGECQGQRQHTDNDAGLQQRRQPAPFNQQEGVGLGHQDRCREEDSAEDAERAGRKLGKMGIGPEERGHLVRKSQEQDGYDYRKPQRKPQDNGNEPVDTIPVLFSGQDAAEARDGAARCRKNQHTDHQQLHADAEGEHAIGPQRT